MPLRSLAAPNILSSLGTKGLNKMNIGIQGVMYPDGLRTMIFAASFKTPIPYDKVLPTAVTLAVSFRAAEYIGRWYPKRGCRCVKSAKPAMRLKEPTSAKYYLHPQ